MVAHIIPRHVMRRADTGTFAAPTVDGINSSGVTLDDVSTSTGLAMASATGSTQLATDSDPFVVSTTVLASATSSSAAAPTTSVGSSTLTGSSTSSGKESISMGTVIAACIGAFAGAAFLIFVGIWLYKRSNPNSGNSRNAQGDHARSRSRLENWNRLPESKGADAWDGQMKEADAQTLAPMDQLTMFKKSTPSVRTMYTHRLSTEELPVFDLSPHPFSQYHADLAKELASSDISQPDRPFAGRQGTAVSYASSANDSFFSLKSTIPPSLDMARPTPALTSSDNHRWESAEVLDFDGQTAEIVGSENPFEHPTERRRSANNPFFSAQERSTYIAPPLPTLARVDKGKGRAVDPNPFDDKPSHTQEASVDSKNDRAIQSLIAALDVSHGDIDEGLHTSAQTATSYSAYSDADLGGSFPSPPHSR